MEKNLLIDRTFVEHWHPRYDEYAHDEPEYKLLLELTGKDLAERGTLTKSTFIGILHWKSPRVKGIVRLDQLPVYEKGIKAAYEAEEDKKLEILIRLHGIGAPVGSTILHFTYPDRFPIFDVRTAETLYRAGRIRHKSRGAAHYPSFRSAMLTILQEVAPFTLRELDRALFAYHKIQLSQRPHGNTDGRKVGREGQQWTSDSTLTIRDKVLSVFQDKAGKRFSREQIIDLVVKAHPGTNRNSVIPTDYCYNLINKDSTSFRTHLFESLGEGRFKCLGPDYPYSGPIIWKGEPVGVWDKGKYELWKDPRR